MKILKLFCLLSFYSGRFFIGVYVLFYNDNSKHDLEFRENRDGVIIISSELNNIRSKITRLL